MQLSIHKELPVCWACHVRWINWTCWTFLCHSSWINHTASLYLKDGSYWNVINFVSGGSISKINVCIYDRFALLMFVLKKRVF